MEHIFCTSHSRSKQSKFHKTRKGSNDFISGHKFSLKSNKAYINYTTYEILQRASWVSEKMI